MAPRSERPDDETPPAGNQRRKGARSSTSRPTSSESATARNPLGLEDVDPFEPGRQEPPPASAAELETGDQYEPPPPELVEWTTERAAAVVKGMGFVLHASDGLGHEPGGERLWRATEEDAASIGAPLARILNRYDAARRLAGLSDEGELAFALYAYARPNLALRGRLMSEKAEREAGLLDETPPWPAPEAEQAGGEAE